MDEAAHNGERIGIDDEKEEGADSRKTGGSARKKNCRRFLIELDSILNQANPVQNITVQQW